MPAAEWPRAWKAAGATNPTAASSSIVDIERAAAALKRRSR